MRASSERAPTGCPNPCALCIAPIPGLKPTRLRAWTRRCRYSRSWSITGASRRTKSGTPCVVWLLLRALCCAAKAWLGRTLSRQSHQDRRSSWQGCPPPVCVARGGASVPTHQRWCSSGCRSCHRNTSQRCNESLGPRHADADLELALGSWGCESHSGHECSRYVVHA